MLPRSLLAASLLAVSLPAQSYVRGFGDMVFDSHLGGLQDFVDLAVGDSHVVARRADGTWSAWGWNIAGQCDLPVLAAGSSPIVEVSAGFLHTIARRADGTFVAWGDHRAGQLAIPSLPAPVVYQRIAAGFGYSMGLRSDGRIDLWGAFSPLAPVPGYTDYVGMAAGPTHAVAIRGNGGAVAWGSDNFSGELNVPVPPPGVLYVGCAAGSLVTLLLRSDGVIVTIGYPFSLLHNVPPLPPGVTYVSLQASQYAASALRSDGQLAYWGQPTATPPALPAGVTYVKAFPGAALRSDGRIVFWPTTGTNPRSMQFAAAHPPGFDYVQVAAGGDWAFEGGGGHTLALSADGTISTFGYNGQGQCTGFPPLPAGRRYTAIAANGDHTFNISGSLVASGCSLALRSDGNVFAWGDVSFGRQNIPPLPQGAVYTGIAAGGQHHLALRSDGSAVAWGNNASGQCNVPPLPAGVSYVEIAAGFAHSLARRSDGVIAAWGDNANGQCNVPPLPAGVTWQQIDAGRRHSAALRSDGSIACWGANNFGQTNVAALPPGVAYVAVSAGSSHTVGRCSDGTLRAWGKSVLDFDGGAQTRIAALPADLSFVEVSAGGEHTVARVGPRRSYVEFGAGCPGSATATRLVPRDTPALGAPLLVRLSPLPANLAIMVTGFDDADSSLGPLPLDLAVLGMTGCSLRVSDDDLRVVAGSSGQGVFAISIPAESTLLGLVFFQQALVFDPAGNGAGAVLSAATRGVIGLP